MTVPITDGSFPFQLIAQPIVTVARVEVRQRESSEPGEQCLSMSDMNRRPRANHEKAREEEREGAMQTLRPFVALDLGACQIQWRHGVRVCSALRICGAEGLPQE